MSTHPRPRVGTSRTLAAGAAIIGLVALAAGPAFASTDRFAVSSSALRLDIVVTEQADELGEAESDFNAIDALETEVDQAEANDVDQPEANPDGQQGEAKQADQPDPSHVDKPHVTPKAQPKAKQDDQGENDQGDETDANENDQGDQGEKGQSGESDNHDSSDGSDGQDGGGGDN